MSLSSRSIGGSLQRLYPSRAVDRRDSVDGYAGAYGNSFLDARCGARQNDGVVNGENSRFLKRLASLPSLDADQPASYFLRYDPSPRFFPRGSRLPVTVTDANFDQDVLGANQPVVVDFWAEWCGPCRFIAPALEEIATEMDGKVTIAKLNVDENPDIMMRYGVRSIPTLIMFKNGEPTAIQVGAVPKNRLSDWIKAAICTSLHE